MRFPFGKRARADDDFAAEIQSHLALETDRLVRAGMSPADARFAARRAFGNPTSAAERFHESRRAAWLERLPQHVWRAARRLLGAPAFSAATILTFALGIGATTAVFSLVNGVLLRPLPFPASDRLVDFSHTLTVNGPVHVDQSDATFLYYRRANKAFSATGAWQSVAVNLGASEADGSDGAYSERVRASRFTAGTFGVLGVPPLRGRTFSEAEDEPGGPAVAVIGERLWKRRYGSDPGIVGRRILIDGLAHEVVGIMPARFAFPEAATALWLPARLDAARTNSAVFDYRGLARLRDGWTVAAAEADLQRLLPQVPDSFPGRLTAGAIAGTHMHTLVRPLRDTVVGDVGRVLWVVLGAAACLLLVACANVTNLFLVRSAGRRHDLAVRIALGAGRGAIVADSLSEGLVLAGLGGALGLGLATVGARLLRSLGAGINIPRIQEVGIDGTVLAVVGAITVLASLLVGLAPAVRSNVTGLASMLTQSGRASTQGRGRQRIQRALVVAQLAIALVLVAGAGLMVRSWRNLRAVRPGFEADSVQTLRVALPEQTYPTAGDVTRVVVTALDDITALNGVRAAGAVSKLPLDPAERRDTAVFIEDHPLSMGGFPNIHQISYATPGYFDAMGIPLLRGRTFERPDASRAPLEVIVTHALAERYWSGTQAVGKRLRLSPGGPWFTVVAVTGDVLGDGLDRRPEETVYLPLVTAPGPVAPDGGAGPARFTPREVAIVVRTSGATRNIVAPLARTLRSLAPEVPVYESRPMTEIVARSAARTTFTLQLLGIASLAALALGAIGIYGVIANVVALRRREIAVRIALGARPIDVSRMVSLQALAMAGIGVAVGLAASAMLSRFLSALLFGVARGDVPTLIGAVVTLSGVAVAASWLPARRAAAVDPALALQAE